FAAESSIHRSLPHDPGDIGCLSESPPGPDGNKFGDRVASYGDAQSSAGGHFPEDGTHVVSQLALRNFISLGRHATTVALQWRACARMTILSQPSRETASRASPPLSATL